MERRNLTPFAQEAPQIFGVPPRLDFRVLGGSWGRAQGLGGARGGPGGRASAGAMSLWWALSAFLRVYAAGALVVFTQLLRRCFGGFTEPSEFFGGDRVLGDPWGSGSGSWRAQGEG